MMRRIYLTAASIVPTGMYLGARENSPSLLSKTDPGILI
jgi:hypothetical protein